MAVAAVESAGMQVPLVAKPLWADGREGSHGLAIVHDEEAIRRLVTPPNSGNVVSPFGPPLMLQQYIDHGGCLFKVSSPWPRCELMHIRQKLSSWTLIYLSVLEICI